MKIYKDNEFIKVAKYRQCANEFLTKMEAEGDVKLEQVVVDDSVATFQYGGVREGQPISFSIPVKRNSGASGITCTYGGTTRSFDFMQYFDYEDFWIWLKSIAKLDTEEAKDGTLPMLVDEWLSIPEHKEFYELARKAFLRYVYFKDHLATNSRCFINMPQTKYMAVASMKSHPVLVYDSNLHDFVKARDNNEICVCVGITSRHTVYVMYSTSDYRERTNEMYPRMFPEFTHVKKGCLSDEHYIETDLDNAVSIVKSVRERLLAFYDDIAKSHGMPDSWKKAKDWS